jgi:hypothetical protein
MADDIRQRILYLRDVMNLSFYQIQDMTGVSKKTAAKIYRGHRPGDRIPRPCMLEKSKRKAEGKIMQKSRGYSSSESSMCLMIFPSHI